MGWSMIVDLVNLAVAIAIGTSPEVQAAKTAMKTRAAEVEAAAATFYDSMRVRGEILEASRQIDTVWVQEGRPSRGRGSRSRALAGQPRRSVMRYAGARKLANGMRRGTGSRNLKPVASPLPNRRLARLSGKSRAVLRMIEDQAERFRGRRAALEGFGPEGPFRA